MNAFLAADLPGAACIDADPLLFFAPEAEKLADRKAREAAARAICARCLVRLRCLEWALGGRVDDGIWGGVDFSPFCGPLCKNKLHLMDAGNTWITEGGTKCRACRIASQGARIARDRERRAELRKAS